MVVDSTIRHTDRINKFLYFTPVQHPVACQVGGSNPEHLAAAVAIVDKYGYDEINLNCGCPSSRVAVCEIPDFAVVAPVLAILFLERTKQARTNAAALLHRYYEIEFYCFYL